LDIITSLILLMLTILLSYFRSAPSRHCLPISAFVAPLGLKIIGKEFPDLL